jgi:phosphotransferase system IIA component
MPSDGVAIDPSKGIVVAPFDGKVIHLFDTNHAIILENTDQIQIIIHIGFRYYKHEGRWLRPTYKSGRK